MLSYNIFEVVFAVSDYFVYKSVYMHLKHLIYSRLVWIAQAMIWTAGVKIPGSGKILVFSTASSLALRLT
jgi:hypothetical protein